MRQFFILAGFLLCTLNAQAKFPIDTVKIKNQDVRLQYDENANLVEVNQKGFITKAKYDKHSNLVALSFPSRPQMYSKLDYFQGKVTTISDETGKVEMSYNKLGQITQKKFTLDSSISAPRVITVGYTYKNQALVAVSYPRVITTNLKPPSVSFVNIHERKTVLQNFLEETRSP